VKRKRLKATFADGKEHFRTIAPPREFTYAWRVTWLRPLNSHGIPTNAGGYQTFDKRESGEHGFSATFELAAKAANEVEARVRKWAGYELLRVEVVAVTDDVATQATD
jgi:hypothetical protein